MWFGSSLTWPLKEAILNQMHGWEVSTAEIDLFHAKDVMFFFKCKIFVLLVSQHYLDIDFFLSTALRKTWMDKYSDFLSQTP